MKFACDTGGTFTDLIVEDDDGVLTMYKAATTPKDPVKGVLDALNHAAEYRGENLKTLLSAGSMLIHGTTHAINAIITGNTAKTAFLTTWGHPDILVLREAGRIEPFNFHIPYPAPYVPRALTFEIPERIGSAGEVMLPLDEAAAIDIIKKLKKLKVESVAVCFLWSIAEPDHELRIGALLDKHLPGVPYTLSHRLNPALREYRRASSTAIDASLKPLMTRYLGSLTERLAEAGFKGRTLVLTSQGGMIDAHDLAERPIHAINSGPSMAPIAGRYYAGLDSKLPNIIIADTGGTTYDVSLVRRGRIPKTRETWIGQPYRGHMTGFSSIEIKSIGAGGGSIAHVDEGRVLHVGPESAGAVPGPVSYGTGGTEPTLTDACVVLDYLDPDYFLGGAMQLDVKAARNAIDAKVAKPLGLSTLQAAASVVGVATENMVQAISEITVNQGIDPAEAVLVGGGGGAGLNSVFIARRLGCPQLVIPETGAALSASGATMSDLSSEYHAMFFTTSADWNEKAANAVLRDLEAHCKAFQKGPGKDARSHSIEFTVEARYASQVWELDVPLRKARFSGKADLARLIADFHAAHQEIFAVRDEKSIVEFVGWTATVSCGVGNKRTGRLKHTAEEDVVVGRRKAYFEGHGSVNTAIHSLHSLKVGKTQKGPAIIESPFTTIVVDPGAKFMLAPSGSVVITP